MISTVMYLQRAPEWSDAALQLARVHLCYRHLDSGTHKLLARATVKTALKKSKALEQERVPE